MNGYEFVPETASPGSSARWSVANPAQGLRATFSSQGFAIGPLEPVAGPPLLTMHLVGWGRAGELVSPAPAEVVATGARIEFRRGPLVEWYVNDPRGLEQGFTVDSSPAAGNDDDLLEIQIALGGRLHADLASEGQSVTLRDEQGVARLSYAKLAVWDADGRTLDAWMHLAPSSLSLRVDTTGAKFPITIDPLIANEQAKLIASDSATGDQLGNAVALDGDTAIVGAWSDDHAGGTNAGAAYVFFRSGTTWTQQAKLTAADAAADDGFGYYVAASGDTVIVGAHRDDLAVGSNAGSAYVFVRNGTSWTQQAKLTASDAAAGDEFGHCVTVSGDTAIVGAWSDDHAGGTDAGSAYVFVRSGTTWTQQAKLTAADAAAGDWFGYCVTVSGDTAVVGAHRDDHAAGNNAGSAYVFVRNGTSWTQQAKLTAADAATDDWFGTSLTLAGDTVVIGAPGDDHVGAGNAGSAYIFVRSGANWSQQDKFIASDFAANDQFGISAAVSNAIAIVGSLNDDNHGSAYVFVRNGTSWSQQAKLTASDAAIGDFFGYSVTLSGETAAVGAYLDNLPGKNDAGSAYVFTLENDAFSTLGSGLAGVNGVPNLSGSGTLAAGSANSLSLTAAAPSAASALFVAQSSTPVPLLGGTLIAYPVTLVVALTTSGNGTLLLPFAWPSGVPAGTSLYFQYAIQDAAAIHGVSLSNGLKGVTP